MAQRLAALAQLLRDLVHVLGIVPDRPAKSASGNHYAALARRKQMMALASCTKPR
jgi:hypothetical protein